MAWFRTWRDVAKYVHSIPPEDRPEVIALREEEYAAILADAALQTWNPYGVPPTSIGTIHGVRIRVLEHDE